MSASSNQVSLAQGLLDQGLSKREAARRLGVAESTLRGWLRRPSSTHVKGDEATLLAGDADLSDIPALLRSRNLNPDEWTVENVVVNEWDGANGVQRQLKIHLRRKIALPLIFPAADVKQRPRPKKRDGGASRLVVFASDQHAPYEDQGLHHAFLSFLHDSKPDEVILGGDTLDNPAISRHRDNPAWSASAQECIQGAFDLLSDYRNAAPDARFRKLLGNHDIRLETELLSRAERMYGLKPAEIVDEDQKPALSLHRLLHLDRLNVELVEPPREGDNYEHAQAVVSPHLGARHGWLTGDKGAERTIERLGHSVIVGHTHHQRMTKRTLWDIDRRPRVVVAVEAGCMCRIEGGLGYSVNANWQNGFATATVWRDGTFKVDLATWVGERLYWRDGRW